LYFIRLASVFVSPLSWVVLLCSLVLMYPVLKAANPLTGIAALLLFGPVEFFTSLMAVNLLVSRSSRPFLLILFIAICAALTAQRLTDGSSIGMRQWLPNHFPANPPLSGR